MGLFSEADTKRIARAITAAEKNTSGEIVAVVAQRSDDYYFIPFLWAALAALAVALPLLVFAAWPAPQVYLAQLAVFAAGALLALWPPTRLMLVPGAVKRARAHRSGVEQFLAQNLHTTKGRTGVLIFVSVAERFAEVIADEGIYKKVPPETWEEVVDGLTGAIREGRAADGFVDAIKQCGAVLAKHFPPGKADRDELPNHLIVLQ
jgi:putative membrane protein